MTQHSDPLRKYAPEDRSMLGEPPWQPADPALIEWEKEHGHDVRLDCDVYTPCHVAIAAIRTEARNAVLDEIERRMADEPFFADTDGPQHGNAAAFRDYESRIKGIIREMRNG